MDYQSQDNFYATHQTFFKKRYSRLTQHCTTLHITVSSVVHYCLYYVYNNSSVHNTRVLCTKQACLFGNVSVLYMPLRCAGLEPQTPGNLRAYPGL